MSKITNIPLPLAKTFNTYSLELSLVLYNILKFFKLHKRSIMQNFSNDIILDNFGSRLQVNKFYSCNTEIDRKVNLNILQRSLHNKIKTKMFLKYSLESSLFNSQSSFGICIYGEQLKNSNLKKISNQLKFFLDPNNSPLKLSNTPNNNLSSLFFCRRFSLIFHRKLLYLFFKNMKKQRKIQLIYLVSAFSRNRYRFSKDKRKRSKFFKKYIWKRRNKRKWKDIFRRFRDRRRLLKKFYTPRFFEINYKTLSLIHLGFFDSQSVSCKIPFWLNLRKLTTLFLF